MRNRGDSQKIAPQLTPEFIREATSQTAWDFGNQVLYDMCSANPEHNLDQIIIGKIWLIGRTYAAAIERRRTAEGASGDAFYETVVAPKIRKSEIDNWFEAIRTGSDDDLILHLEVHMRVMKLFTAISGLEKRSLASKYLHFHFPQRFYIYDARAYKVICELTDPVGKTLPILRDHDNVYARFYLRCLDLRRRIDSQLGQNLSMREFDNVLLAYTRTALR
jgi:hypothetical protein